MVFTSRLMRFVISACCILLAQHPAWAVVEFQFTYFDVVNESGAGFDDPLLGAQRRNAFESTAASVGARIVQDAVVQIGVAPSQTDGTDFIGIGGATFVDANAPAAGIRDGEVYRRIVLGEPDTFAGFDGGMAFDFGYAMALSGEPADGVPYFPDIARHELTHLLGWGSFLNASGTGRNGTALDVYTRFDSFLRTRSGAPVIGSSGDLLLSAAAFSFAYATGLVFDGPATRAANGGQPLAIYPGSTSHSLNPIDVMYVSPANGFARDTWTDRDIGVLVDLGYMISSDGPAGDFNADGALDVLDIDLLSQGVRSGTNAPTFDVNLDGLVNEEDRRVWVEDYKSTYFGDANLDRRFDTSDLVQVFIAGAYEVIVETPVSWQDGDWNGDGSFDTSDLVTAFQSGGYELGPRNAIAELPEPTSLVLLCLGFCSVAAICRQPPKP